MRQSHLILSNAAIMWATQVLLLAPGLILVPFLIGSIGESAYGVYALVWSLVAAVEQLQMSLQQGVVKYSAGFLAQGKIDEVNGIVSSSFVYSVALATVGCVSTFVAAAYSGDTDGRIGSVLTVVGIMILFTAPLTPYVAVIQAKQRYYVGAIAGTASRYASLLAVVTWFAVVGPSLKALIIIMVGAMFLSRLIQVPVAYRLIPGLQNRPQWCNARHVKLIVSFGGMTIVVGLCLTMNTAGVRWMMNALASTDFVAHLAIILTPSGLLSGIVGALVIPAMPATSAYAATGNQQMLKELLIRGMRYSTIVLLAGVLPASLLIKNALGIWVGDRYLFLAPYALALFASTAFMESTTVLHHMLKGLGKLRIVVLIYCLGLVVVPGGMILAIFETSRDPYIAATVGLAAGHCVCGALNIWSCTKAVDANLRVVIMRVYAQPLAIAAAVCAMSFGAVSFGGLNGTLSKSLVAGLALACFLGASFVVIATPAERREISDVIAVVLGRVVRSGAKAA